VVLHVEELFEVGVVFARRAGAYRDDEGRAWDDTQRCECGCEPRVQDCRSRLDTEKNDTDAQEDTKDGLDEVPHGVTNDVLEVGEEWDHHVIREETYVVPKSKLFLLFSLGCTLRVFERSTIRDPRGRLW
jgi:hypothetical protein